MSSRSLSRARLGCFRFCTKPSGRCRDATDQIACGSPVAKYTVDTEATDNESTNKTTSISSHFFGDFPASPKYSTMFSYTSLLLPTERFVSSVHRAIPSVLKLSVTVNEKRLQHSTEEEHCETSVLSQILLQKDNPSHLTWIIPSTVKRDPTSASLTPRWRITNVFFFF